MKKFKITVKYDMFYDDDEMSYEGMAEKVVPSGKDNNFFCYLITEIKNFVRELNVAPIENENEVLRITPEDFDYPRFNKSGEIEYRLIKSLYPEKYVWVHQVVCTQVDPDTPLGVSGSRHF